MGYNQTTYSSWAQTLDNHIELSEQLHEIKNIIVLDHMQCGAYKLLYNQPSMTRQAEINLHIDNFAKFKQTINTKYPHLTVTTLLMDLDGSIMTGYTTI